MGERLLLEVIANEAKAFLCSVRLSAVEWFALYLQTVTATKGTGKH